MGDNSECELYNACQWSGYFAYVNGKQPYEWVASTDIIAFFSSYGDNSAYGNKRLRMKVNNTVVEAEVLDTCGDSDCKPQCGIWADLLADRRWLSNSHSLAIPGAHPRRQLLLGRMLRNLFSKQRLVRREPVQL